MLFSPITSNQLTNSIVHRRRGVFRGSTGDQASGGARTDTGVHAPGVKIPGCTINQWLSSLCQVNIRSPDLHGMIWLEIVVMFICGLGWQR